MKSFAIAIAGFLCVGCVHSAPHSQSVAPDQSQPSASAQYNWVVAISEKVTSKWVRPQAAATDSFPCEVKLAIAADGQVKEITLLKPCGSAALEQSLRDAIIHSSPLPTPPDPSVMVQNMVFRFRP